MGNLLLGRSIADKINQLTRNDIAALKKNNHIQPLLVIISTGESNPRLIYEVILHEKLALDLGINVKKIILDASIEENKLLEIIEQCNKDNQVHGILVLLPLSDHINQNRILSSVDQAKELEGLNETKRIDTIFEGKHICIISSMFTLLESVGYDLLSGKNILLIDDNILESNLVVIKLLKLAASLNIIIETVKSSEKNIHEITTQADLLLFSLIEPETIDKKYFNENAIAIDFNPITVGETYSEEKGRVVPLLKTCLNVESVLAKAKHVAPSLGGIGPIVLAYLMRNVVFNCHLTITQTA
jgi:methylenetetrahydrofolate dehydrogenase (NADP+) / methenyltetrahydrofolate cyclohydrolase